MCVIYVLERVYVVKSFCGEFLWVYKTRVFAVSPVHAEMAKQRIDQTLLEMFCW